MPMTQDNREIAVATPLGKDALLLKGFTATEQMSRPFRIELDLLADINTQVPLEKVLGQRFTVRVGGRGSTARYFNGHVSRWQVMQVEGGVARYRATLVPWLWLLTRNANCRMFQDKTVLEIVEQIVKTDHGFVDFQPKLNGTYDPIPYCVQYRETDFNFVSRLLEQHGIFYYFKHEDQKHTMVLGDSLSAYAEVRGQTEIKYQIPSQSKYEQCVQDIALERLMQPLRYVQTDFDFEKPRTSLETRKEAIAKDVGSTFEIFDYPGGYKEVDAGTRLAAVRLDEFVSDAETAQGEGTSRALTLGHKFTLSGTKRADFDKAWLVTGTTIHAEVDDYQGTDGSTQSTLTYQCTFSVLKADRLYRPARLTPKPLISGPQTALVCGKSGEEIWTDKYGRIKVQFHWDRASKGDETSSCWLRVAQPWAGKGYGAMFLPRVGHEVIVEFLEGDPDRPIVTGCVYNDVEMPPYKLPDNMTRSYIKTTSSKGAGGFNEVRFEDKKGSEQIFVNAQKNFDLRIKEDSMAWVGKNRNDIVIENAYEKVEKDRHTKIGGSDIRDVAKDDSVKVGGEKITEVTGKMSVKVTGDVVEVFNAAHSETVTSTYYLKANGGLVIECPAGITLKCGGNSVVLDPGGVTVKGTTVTLDGAMTKINSGPGSPPSSGSAGSATGAKSTTDPTEADSAEPGKASEVQARNVTIKKQQSETASAAPAAAGSSSSSSEEKPKTWYEFEIIDADSKPVKNEPVLVHKKDGSKVRATTNSQGVVRIEDVEEGDIVSYSLPERESTEVADLGAGERRQNAGGSGSSPAQAGNDGDDPAAGQDGGADGGPAQAGNEDDGNDQSADAGSSDIQAYRETDLNESNDNT